MLRGSTAGRGPSPPAFPVAEGDLYRLDPRGRSRLMEQAMGRGRSDGEAADVHSQTRRRCRRRGRSGGPGPRRRFALRGAGRARVPLPEPPDRTDGHRGEPRRALRRRSRVRRGCTPSLDRPGLEPVGAECLCGDVHLSTSFGLPQAARLAARARAERIEKRARRRTILPIRRDRPWQSQGRLWAGRFGCPLLFISACGGRGTRHRSARSR